MRHLNAKVEALEGKSDIAKYFLSLHDDYEKISRQPTSLQDTFWDKHNTQQKEVFAIFKEDVRQLGSLTGFMIELKVYFEYLKARNHCDEEFQKTLEAMKAVVLHQLQCVTWSAEKFFSSNTKASSDEDRAPLIVGSPKRHGGKRKTRNLSTRRSQIGTTTSSSSKSTTPLLLDS